MQLTRPLGPNASQLCRGDCTRSIAYLRLSSKASLAEPTLLPAAERKRILSSSRELDTGTLLDSVAKTGRCVIVHEAPLRGGFGAEIAALLAGPGLMSLLAPVERVAGYDTVMPLARLEHDYLPGPGRILAAARRVLEH